MSDTKKFRQAFKDAGFRNAMQFLPTVYNDRAKNGTRRLKLDNGDHVFSAPDFAQEALEQHLEQQFGHRYLGGQFIPQSSSWGRSGTLKSFCVYLIA